MSQPLVAMWAHSRSASTAFLRMMIERGDVAVLHEPFLALTEEGSLTLPSPDGGQVTARSEKDLLVRLAELARARPVFVKEVLDYEYPHLFKHPEDLAGFAHTFIVRDPRPTIASHYAIKPAVTCAEIGYERLFRLFELVREATGRRPLVIRTERLVREPAAVVEEFCAYTGLPFLPGSLTWAAGDRPEWRRTRRWHLDASGSAGFEDRRNSYTATVDNHPALRAFYDHHLPFYQRLVQYE
ncbi:sulfotransferase family protein [Nonomuraea spiralis]|uniref:Sulfotransferase family protein n=1 Tax=Nonomuraea spiralis TaxID=46182 RepID=A0ABV5INR4_9ACTN|nr:sulfotransferase family protein [Nonomuraea spiralis]